MRLIVAHVIVNVYLLCAVFFYDMIFLIAAAMMAFMGAGHSVQCQRGQ